MSKPDTLETVESSDPLTTAPNRQVRWRWQWLVAPLMGISVLLHIALLFVPIPTWNIVGEEEPEAEPPPETDEAIDILSLSEIPTPEPPAEPQQQPERQQQQAPPPGAVPPPPDPDQVQDLPPEDEVITEEEDLPLEDELPPETGGFDPGRQSQLAGAGSQNIGGSEFGSINAQTELIVAYIQQSWPPALNRDCFLAGLDPATGLEPAPGGLGAFYLTNNAEFIPPTLCDNGFCTDFAPAGEYCGAPLYELRDNGTPQFFASVVEVVKGSGLAVIWGNDPR